MSDRYEELEIFYDYYEELQNKLINILSVIFGNDFDYNLINHRLCGEFIRVVFSQSDYIEGRVERKEFDIPISVLDMVDNEIKEWYTEYCREQRELLEEQEKREIKRRISHYKFLVQELEAKLDWEILL